MWVKGFESNLRLSRVSRLKDSIFNAWAKIHNLLVRGKADPKTHLSKVSSYLYTAFSTLPCYQKEKGKDGERVVCIKLRKHFISQYYVEASKF
jgi:hypothetical protein